MAEYTADANHTAPDYELAEELELTRPDQYRALFEETRQEIVALLLERAATTSDLAIALGKPKGTIGHHLKTLEEAGLVRVVRTKRVRAIEAKYYGRTARVFLFHRVGEGAGHPERALSTAAAEIASVPGESELPLIGHGRYVRIPVKRAEEWANRLNGLLREFSEEPRGGDITFAMYVALYPTKRGRLPDPEAPHEHTGEPPR